MMHGQKNIKSWRKYSDCRCYHSGSQRLFCACFLPNLPKDKRVRQFCDYHLENYIDADSTFPPPVWSDCSASSFRTTKACESFHAHFNALFYIAHPNILFLYLHCKKIQNETYIKMRCVTKRRLKYSVNSSPKKLKYRANLISRIEFVSYKYKVS